VSTKCSETLTWPKKQKATGENSEITCFQTKDPARWRCHCAGSLYSLQQIADPVEHQNVRGIERIEGELQKWRSDKAALAVIQMDGHEGGTGGNFSGKQGIGQKRLNTRCISEKMDHKDQQRAVQSVICLQHDGDRAHSGHSKKFQKLMDLCFVGVDQYEPQKQSKKDILPTGIQPTVAMKQIEGELRNKGEDQQPKAVAHLVSGVRIALRDQKAKDRKGQPAELAHDPVQSDGPSANTDGNAHCVDHGIKDHGRMVNGHADDRQQFQHTAAEDSESVFCEFVYQGAYLLNGCVITLRRADFTAPCIVCGRRRETSPSSF